MRTDLLLGSFLGGTAVVLGAFGTHALRGSVGPHELEVFETGVRYQIYHAVALMAMGGQLSGQKRSQLSALWGAGLLLFSGSLYAIALTGVARFGMITPIGGLLLIAGWILAGLSAFREHSQ